MCCPVAFHKVFYECKLALWALLTDYGNIIWVLTRGYFGKKQGIKLLPSGHISVVSAPPKIVTPFFKPKTFKVLIFHLGSLLFSSRALYCLKLRTLFISLWLTITYKTQQSLVLVYHQLYLGFILFHIKKLRRGWNFLCRHLHSHSHKSKYTPKVRSI